MTSMNKKPQKHKSEGKGTNTAQVNSVLAEWMSRLVTTATLDVGNFELNNNSNISLYFPKTESQELPSLGVNKIYNQSPLQAAASNPPTSSAAYGTRRTL